MRIFHPLVRALCVKLLLCATVLISLTFTPSYGYADFPKVYAIESPRNQLNAWVVEDHYLPIVALEIAFTHSGSAYDPQHQTGLAYLASNMMLEGTKNHSAQAIREAFETLASSVTFSVDKDCFYVSLKTLAKNLDESLALLSEILMQPQFDNATLSKVVTQVNTLRARQEEDPDYIASRALAEALFKQHPYAKSRYGSEEALAKLNPVHIKRYIKTNLTRENMVISVAGNVNSAVLALALDRYFGGLPKSASKQTLPSFNWPEKGSTVLIEKDIPQSVIHFALPAVTRSDEAFYPLYMLNHIMGGGGFESRLMKKLREKEGLVYHTGTTFNSLDKLGLIEGNAATQNKTTDKAVRLLKSELTRGAKEGITINELKDSRDYLVYGFPLKLTKNTHLAKMISSMQLHGLPIDFLQTRNALIEQVTLSDINALAKTYLDTNKMVMVVVGGDGL
jgi:zinc protease